MSTEIIQQQQDVTVYRCDFTDTERCTQQTASFQKSDTVVVLLDPAWLIVRAGLDTEKHFCSWQHMRYWTEREESGWGYTRETGKPVDDRGTGIFATRLREAAAARDQREEAMAEHLKARMITQNEAAALLGLPAGS